MTAGSYWKKCEWNQIKTTWKLSKKAKTTKLQTWIKILHQFWNFTIFGCFSNLFFFKWVDIPMTARSYWKKCKWNQIKTTWKLSNKAIKPKLQTWIKILNQFWNFTIFGCFSNLLFFKWVDIPLTARSYWKKCERNQIKTTWKLSNKALKLQTWVKILH